MRTFCVTCLGIAGVTLGCSADDSTLLARDDAGGADATVDTSSDATQSDVGPGDAPVSQDAGRCSVTGDGRTTVSFVNLCAQTVSFRGSDIEAGDVDPGGVACRDVGAATGEIASKRYWGFVGEDPGAGRHSLAEFTFNTDFEDYDWYNLSHVDAFNLPLRILAVDRAACRTLTCADDLLAGCPEAGRYPSDGETVACVSPDRDDPTNPVAVWFEAGCADAYSWSKDDAESMAACAGEDYDIVFCPPAD